MENHLGLSAVLKTLVDSEIAYSNVSAYFGAFANAMTNRFRFQFGAGTFNLTEAYLPAGEVTRLALRTETCVSAQMDWLASRICLTAVTTIIMIWTMTANWRRRSSRPVWKDSILPLIYYGHRIESKDPSARPRRLQQTDETSDGAGTEALGKLLESSEINKIGSNTPVTFRWPDSLETDGDISGSSTFALQSRKSWLRQRKPQEMDVDSLLETTDVHDYSASDTKNR
ncbi:hypothetical protein HBI70_026800 [Parastagonospora nodorum]|nr:hypothetical protein HBH46_116930 [Parastagonospora nodorum]KAH4194142.1 hypothetical protein HBH42_093450 [Parastagonospora nodorum]KAH4417855.1 hypothetical protein HBH92_051810 [Parastagonospora nodorum]KAH4449487.1 hypothetical protein HBH93_037250 [Parastagonospora nodorum]KAH4463595.1 hypothetical protein HBH91_047870 [Parastagonospora nodorum]